MEGLLAGTRTIGSRAGNGKVVASVDGAATDAKRAGREESDCEVRHRRGAKRLEESAPDVSYGMMALDRQGLRL